MLTFFSQLLVQFKRNVTLFLSDKVNLLLAVIQAPVIALLAVLAFGGNAVDCQKNDLTVRTLWYYNKLTEKIPEADVRDLSEYARKAYDLALQNDNESSKVCSEAMAQNRAMIYFVLVAAAIWMGILGSCKEIVSEWEVIHRESHSGVMSSAYIIAKTLFLCIVVGGQTFLLAYLSLPNLIPGSLSFVRSVWLILWLSASCSVVLGLLISCFSASLQVALTCVPILMIPQILLGGFLRPPARDVECNVYRMIASGATLQRWAFEACIALETRSGKEHLPKDQIIEIFLEKVSDAKQERQTLQNNIKRAWRILAWRGNPLDVYFFGGQNISNQEFWTLHFLLPVKILSSVLFVSVLLLCLVMKIRIWYANSGGRGFLFFIPWKQKNKMERR